jgi:hypothetical protein
LHPPVRPPPPAHLMSSVQSTSFGIGSSRTVDTIRLCVSDQYGTVAFNGCKWCRRDRTCENPLTQEKEQYPFLRFRGERHTMCNCCAGTLRRKHPMSMTGDARDKKLALIAGNEVTFHQWLVDVAQVEDEQNTVISAKRRRVRGSSSTKDGSEMDLACARSHVDGSQGSSMSARRHLGVLWPAKVFEAAVGRPPKKDEITKISLAGETFTGVIRDRAVGCPTGCIELFDDKFTMVLTGPKQEAIF